MKMKMKIKIRQQILDGNLIDQSEIDQTKSAFRFAEMLTERYENHIKTEYDANPDINIDVAIRTSGNGSFLTVYIENEIYPAELEEKIKDELLNIERDLFGEAENWAVEQKGEKS